MARSSGSVAAYSLVRAGWLDVPTPSGPASRGRFALAGTLRTSNVLQPPDPLRRNLHQVAGPVGSYTMLPSESLANPGQDSYKESCSIFAKLRAQLGLGSIPFRQCLSEASPTGTCDLDHSRPSVLPVRQHDEAPTRKRLQIPCKPTAFYPQHVSQVSQQAGPRLRQNSQDVELGCPQANRSEEVVKVPANQPRRTSHLEVQAASRVF
jgi:hypothetical protein